MVFAGLLIPERDAFASDNDFVIVNGVLKEYKGSGGAVIIPEGVTKIGAEAFALCENLTSVTIPDGVTQIEEEAFFNCSRLTYVTIPIGVTEIEDKVFFGCSSLTNVVIPDGISKIGYKAFYGCSSLVNIVIPDGVIEIRDLAFYACKELSNITIPSSVTKIGDSVFIRTPWLDKKRAENDDHLVIINHILIEGVHASGKITIPDGVKIIKNDAFLNSANITGVIMPTSVTEIGNNAFYYCSNLSTVVLSNAITKIGDAAFYNCTSLKEITIPKNVTKLGADVFSRCNSLNKITLLNKKINLYQVDKEGNLNTLLGNTLANMGIRENKKSNQPLTIYGYKYSTADELVVRMNTLQATSKAFGVQSLKFVPLDKKNTTLDKIKVPASMTITKGKSKKLSITLPSTLKRVKKFTKKQGQVKISITYSKEALNKYGCYFLDDTKKVSNDTINGLKKGTGYAYTTVTQPDGDKKVFATKIIVK